MEDTESKGKQPTEGLRPSTRGGAAPERKAKSDAELRAIMKTLMENPDAIADLPDDDVIELKQRINPVGTFEPAQKSYAVASIINMKEADMRKFMMTAMIGFVYRRLEEYVPDFVVAMEESYAAKINEATVQEHRDGLREECKRRAADYKRAHQTVIRTFLDSIFSFDPDKHVRRAPAELPVDAFDIIAGPRPAAKDAAATAAPPVPAPAPTAPAAAATSAAATAPTTSAIADLVVSRERSKPGHLRLGMPAVRIALTLTASGPAGVSGTRRDRAPWPRLGARRRRAALPAARPGRISQPTTEPDEIPNQPAAAFRRRLD